MPFYDHILYQWHEFGKITFNTKIKKSLGKINQYLMNNNRSNLSILNNGIEKTHLRQTLNSDVSIKHSKT